MLSELLKDKDKRIYACEKSLMLFSIYYFTEYHKYKMPDFHKDWYNAFLNKQILSLITFRESAKTSLAKIKLIHDIVYKKKKLILWVSFDKSKAKSNLFDIAVQLQTNKKLIGDFGQLFFDTGSEEKSTKKSIDEFITENDIKVKAFSTGQTTRGEVYKENRPDLICQPKGNNVITDKGYKDVSEIMAGDNVLSHTGKFRRVSKNWKVSNKTIYKIKLKSLPYDVRFSDKHLVYAKTYNGLFRKRFNNFNKPLFVEVNNIKKGDLIGFPINNKYERYGFDILWRNKYIISERDKIGRIVRNIQGKSIKKEFLDENDYYLIGQYLGDGSLKNAGIVIYCDANKQWIIDKIKKHSKYGITEIRKKNVVQIHIASSKLQRICSHIKKKKNSCKVLPIEVESELLNNQYKLLQGYIESDGFIDKKHNCIRITSVCLPLLEQIQRILLRFGIIGYIRNGIEGNDNYDILGYKCKTQKKYDLYFRDNAFKLGYDIKNQERYKNTLNYIENGYLWSYVQHCKKEEKKEDTFAFSVEKDKSYCNHLVANHNCLDDIENLDTIQSELKTEQVKRFFDELLGGISKDCQIIVLGNRLTNSGSITYFENKIKGMDGVYMCDIPVVKDGVITWDSKYCSTDEEAKISGKISLETKKKLLGYQSYNREMLNIPLTDEEKEFKKEWIRTITRQEIDAKNTRKFLTIDTALSEKTSADFTGFCENYVDSENFWNLSAYQMKLNPKDLIDYIFTLQDKRGFELIGIEKTAYTIGLKPSIDEECRKRGRFLPIVELSHNQIAKETRIRGLIPRYSNISVRHIEGECKDLEEQLDSFPRCIHDDVLDAVAYQLNIAQKPNNYEEFDEKIDDLYPDIGI